MAQSLDVDAPIPETRRESIVAQWPEPIAGPGEAQGWDTEDEESLQPMLSRMIGILGIAGIAALAVAVAVIVAAVYAIRPLMAA